MVDRIKKVLKKLEEKQRRKLTEIIERIVNNTIDGLDVRKLAGRNDVFRVRVGQHRIIFKHLTDHTNQILILEKRSDTTYRTKR